MTPPSITQAAWSRSPQLILTHTFARGGEGVQFTSPKFASALALSFLYGMHEHAGQNPSRIASSLLAARKKKTIPAASLSHISAAVGDSRGGESECVYVGM